MSTSNPGDVAAVWEVHLSDGIHVVRFEHGTTSGKRVIFVDQEEVIHRNWMFKLVGTETFKISQKTAEIIISTRGMSFEYVLNIDGKSLKKFVESQAKNTRTWVPVVNGCHHRVVLDISTMDVYTDGEKNEICGEFTDEGTETHFTMAGHSAYIKAVSSGNKRKGLVYTLVIGGEEIEPVHDIAAFEQ